MALLNSIAEIRKYISVQADGNLNLITPFIVQAQNKYILPLLDAVTLKNLDDHYNASPQSLTTAEQALLPYVQQPLAYLAYYLGMDIMALKISDTGFSRSDTGTNQTGYKYQTDAMREAMANTGFDGLEALLAFLEANAADYADWKASNAFTIINKFFINSAIQFNSFYDIRGSRRTFMALRACIQKAEQFHLYQNLSPAYFTELKTKILGAGSNTLNDDDNYLLDNFIRPALAHLAMYQAYFTLNFVITDNGLVLQTSKAIREDNTETVVATANQVALARGQAWTDGNTYLRDMKDYLNQNASADKYPTYFASSAYVAPTSTTDPSTIDNSNAGNTIYFGF